MQVSLASIKVKTLIGWAGFKEGLKSTSMSMSMSTWMSIQIGE